jgi:hypothetical protein
MRVLAFVAFGRIILWAQSWREQITICRFGGDAT